MIEVHNTKELVSALASNNLDAGGVYAYVSEDGAISIYSRGGEGGLLPLFRVVAQTQDEALGIVQACGIEVDG